MKSLTLMSGVLWFVAAVLPAAVFSQAGMGLTSEDKQEIKGLSSQYSSALGECDAEGLADLFVPETGYFASGFRGRIAGHDRLIALVKSERHCNVAEGSPPATRRSQGNRPDPVIEATATGAHGLTEMGSARYEDEYVRTPQGWRIAARTVITSAEKDAGIDASELTAIHTLLGPDLVDHYVTNENGVNRLMTSGVAIRISDGMVTGRAYVSGGGYNDDVYEKTGPGQWRVQSRTFVPKEVH